MGNRMRLEAQGKLQHSLRFSFGLDWIAVPFVLLFATGCYLLNRYKQYRFPSPKIYVSHLESFRSDRKTWKENFSHSPHQIAWFSLCLLLLASLDPRLYFDRSPTSFPDSFATEGLALYFVVDHSSSMAETIQVQLPDRENIQAPKIDLVKRATQAFIEGDPMFGLSGRPNDMIGLVEFARTARVEVPLTLDRKALLEQLSNMTVVNDRSQNATAIGYAILKTAHLIVQARNYARDLLGKGKSAYEIKGSAIILVTDGMHDPHPEDKGSRWRQMDPKEAANYAKEHNIRLYIINIEPRLNTEQYAPNRRQLEKAAELTGGKFFVIGQSQNMSDIYLSINDLEKSTLPIDRDFTQAIKNQIPKEKLPAFFKTFFLAPYLIFLAIITLFSSVFLSSSFLRRVP